MSAERKGLLRSTAAVIAGSLVGVWWWLRVRAKTNIERPLSSHPYIAIDIVLLPPEQIRKSCYAFNRGITTDYFIFGETRHPHISLIQSLIKVGNQVPPFNWICKTLRKRQFILTIFFSIQKMMKIHVTIFFSI